MEKFDNKISAWNFKKIAKTYLIALLVAVIACAAAAGVVFKDRLSFAWQYGRVEDAAESNDTAKLKTEIDKLAAASGDVVDILILDDSNNVSYSAKNSPFSKGSFALQKAGDDRDYLVSKTDDSVVFKYVKGDEFMLNSVFTHDYGEIRDEYDDESFFETGHAARTVYMLSFIGDRHSGSKVYIISSPTTVPGGAVTVRAIETVGMLLFMAYWVLLALWAYQNALKAKLSAPLWGIVVLLTNLAGVLVLVLYKRANASCPTCGASQSRDHLYCTSCGTKLGDTCPSCGAQIGKNDDYCPNCGKSMK